MSYTSFWDGPAGIPIQAAAILAFAGPIAGGVVLLALALSVIGLMRSFAWIKNVVQSRRGECVIACGNFAFKRIIAVVMAGASQLETESIDRSSQFVPTVPVIDKPVKTYDSFSDAASFITKEPCSPNFERDIASEVDAKSLVSIALAEGEEDISIVSLSRRGSDSTSGDYQDTTDILMAAGHDQGETGQYEKYAIDGGICLARESFGALHETSMPNPPTRISSITVIILPPPYFPHTDDLVPPPPPLPEHLHSTKSDADNFVRYAW